MGTLPTDKFCGTGRDFKAEREKQDQAIEDSQREMASANSPQTRSAAGSPER